jgi:nucleotide-binding universal stress UspA family protein
VSSSDALHAVLFDSGRPGADRAQRGAGSIGTRICCAWNGSAESRGRDRRALPWLHRAEGGASSTPTSTSARAEGGGHPAYLHWHEIEAEAVQFKPMTKDVGAGLLGRRARLRGDLLCMGAYSHSRLRQLILGGVTRHVLENSDVPVLMCR